MPHHNKPLFHVITPISSTIGELFRDPLYMKFLRANLAAVVLTLLKDGKVRWKSSRLAGLVTMKAHLMTQHPPNANVWLAVIHLIAESFDIDEDRDPCGDTVEKARALINRDTTDEEISGDLYGILMSEAHEVFDSCDPMRSNMDKIDPDRAVAIMAVNKVPYQTPTEFFRAIVMDHYAVSKETLTAFLDPGQTWCQPKHYLVVLSEYTLLHQEFGTSFAAKCNNFTDLHEWINLQNGQVVCSVFTTDNNLYGDSFFQHIVGNPMERFVRGQQCKGADTRSIGDIVLETLLTRQPSDTTRKEYTVHPVHTNSKWIAKLGKWKRKTHDDPLKFHLLK